ncbi:MAG: epoxyqueuosine reductase QueH [Synergistaceae bacterium]|nr:epoxyqueuosine reductase QueH [Synergistaceae bacterium]
MKKNLLLHICCAPDASVPVPDLLNEGWNVKGFFYGSNIHPFDEYQKRLEALGILIKHTGIECEILPYNPDEWLEKIHGLDDEPEGGRRCEKCFELQLEAGACCAKKFGFENFCTTLTISPHKNVNLINSIGEKISSACGAPDSSNIIWQNRIWRKNNGFLRSIRASKELGLYRQNYCGCVYSMRN